MESCRLTQVDEELWGLLFRLYEENASRARREPGGMPHELLELIDAVETRRRYLRAAGAVPMGGSRTDRWPGTDIPAA